MGHIMSTSLKKPLCCLLFVLAASPVWADSDRLADRGAVPSATGAQQPADYRLGSGDHVKVTVFGQDDLTGDYSVDGTGKLSFPLIGQITAQGMTAHDLENAIAGRLRPDYIRNPHVSVQIMAYRPFYIVGEVKTPGSYAFVSGMTVLNAVALAGGFTYRADDDDVYVRRAGSAEERSMPADPATKIFPGDIVRVRERLF